MFNFTGSARRPRNVNLSGRKSTPAPSLASSSLRNKPAPSSSLQAAREERAAREAERKRLKAAGTIQRTWRGRKAIELKRTEWRATWDSMATQNIDPSQVPLILSLFLGFTDIGRSRRRRIWSKDDLERLGHMVEIFHVWIGGDIAGLDGRMQFLGARLGRLLVETVGVGIVQGEQLKHSLQLLAKLARAIPRLVDDEYYATLSNITGSNVLWLDDLIEAVVSPLQPEVPDNEAAFRAFNARYLTTPSLTLLLGERGTSKLISGVNLRRVASSFSLDMGMDNKLWLLAHVIYFNNHGRQVIDFTGDPFFSLTTEKEEYIKFLSLLLSSVAIEVGQRIDIEDVNMEESDGDESPNKIKRRKDPLPDFVKQQIESLVQQSSISSLLSSTRSTDGNVNVLAGFALTLLLVFPAQRTDMRFWLCVASTSDGIPAVKYVWGAVKRCQLFASIKGDAKFAVKYLKSPPTFPVGSSAQSVEDQWNLIFLFLEMYSFVLVTGDDHEFLQGKGRQLAMEDVGELTLFLKNLSFAMYWWFGDIIGEDKTKDTGGEVYFRPHETGRAWELGYFRSVVMDVLKAIYTREYAPVYPPIGVYMADHGQFSSTFPSKGPLAHGEIPDIGWLHCGRCSRRGEPPTAP